MKINFKKIKVFTNISHTESKEMDIKDQISDFMYKNSNGIAYHSLAMKIYNSSEECELNEQEYNLLMEFVYAQCTPIIIDAFKQFEDNNV